MRRILDTLVKRAGLGGFDYMVQVDDFCLTDMLRFRCATGGVGVRERLRDRHANQAPQILPAQAQIDSHYVDQELATANRSVVEGVNTHPLRLRRVADSRFG
jgi:hypothetical protein